MKFSDSEYNLATANEIQRQRIQFSDSKWDLATANGIQRQRIEVQRQRIKFNDSEFSLATANQIQRILKQMDDHRLIAARAYPRFCSMKRLEVFLLPLDRMPVHHRSLPSNLSGFPNNMSAPILTFSLKFNVSKTSTNRVYVNQFYCQNLYTGKTTGFQLYVRNRLVSHTCTHCGAIFSLYGVALSWPITYLSFFSW